MINFSKASKNETTRAEQHFQDSSLQVIVMFTSSQPD